MKEYVQTQRYRIIITRSAGRTYAVLAWGRHWPISNVHFLRVAFTASMANQNIFYTSDGANVRVADLVIIFYIHVWCQLYRNFL